MKNSAPQNKPKIKTKAKQPGLVLVPWSALVNQGGCVHLGLEYLGG
jgi:hypothetical protein